MTLPEVRSRTTSDENAVAAVMLTHGEAETERVAERLAADLLPGQWVLLYGDLGSGKTAFVRGLARGLGADPGDVTSPSFTLVQEYRGRLTLIHADLYRLAPAEAAELGLEDYAAEGAVIAVEWAERFPLPVPGAVEVHLREAGDSSREVEIRRPGDPFYSER